MEEGRRKPVEEVEGGAEERRSKVGPVRAARVTERRRKRRDIVSWNSQIVIGPVT